MDQERIGKFIKDIRKKNKLTQEKFASKYGVTYQAVSKWENGKNIPDISILREICNDYDIDINDLLSTNKSKKKISKTLITILSLVIIVITLIVILLYSNNKSSDFNFKTLSTSCDDFNLFGTIAYSDSKTSIYISNITYCGKNENIKYRKIDCTLYENDGSTKTKIDSYTYDGEITLEKFLSNVNFTVEHYSKSCKMYQDNALHLEIEATTLDNEIVYYKIPLTLEKSCE